MNPKTTGILFAIAAALGAFVYFYEIRGEEGRKQAEEAEKRLFPVIEAETIESITLPAGDSPAVRIERRDGRWQIVAPIDFAADTFAADGIASALAELTSESQVEDPQPHEVYGLDAADRNVHFRAGGVERVLRLGDNTPLGSNSYAAVDDSKLPKTERLAFYINLYNATMIDVIVDRVFDGYSPEAEDYRVFKDPLVRLKGRRISLNDLENKIIRKDSRGPRSSSTIKTVACRLVAVVGGEELG